VIAGKVLNLDGSQHRFAFARNCNSASEFADAIVSAGGRFSTAATVLSDGDAGRWKLQRQAVPEATLLLDWWHIAMRFEHALQAARGIGQGTTSVTFAPTPFAISRVPSGSSGTAARAPVSGACKIGELLDCGHVRDVRSAVATQRYVDDLIEYLHANRHALVNYGRRRHEGLPISSAFVESAVNEIFSKRMIKKQQMRWNRWTVQPFLDVRTAVLNVTLRGSFRRLYPAFQADNDNRSTLVAA
jgi:hypothetical protein